MGETLAKETANGTGAEALDRRFEQVNAFYDAWAEIVDLGIAMMLDHQARTHPDRDPWEYVREQIRRQAIESHEANLRAFRKS